MKYTPEYVLDADPDNMAGGIYNFLDDLSDAMETPIDIKPKFDKILICGMGGSAISGDILADCMYSYSNLPISIQRFPELPEWVNKNTFVIIASYSGNTRETLALYEDAIERDLKTTIITAGGHLMEKAENDGHYILKMVPGLQPRCATGYSLGLLFNLIDHIGKTNFKEQVGKLMPKLEKFRDELASNKSLAWEIARRINGRTPVIYSTPEMASSAIRWKTQINENSKMMAFSGLMPEFNHNDVSGWSEGAVRDSCVPIFLYEEKMSKVKKKAMDAAIDVLKSYDVEPMIVKIRGRSTTEKLLRSVMIGDYVSLYLAYINGVDPSKVAAISELKVRLADILPYTKSRAGKKNTSKKSR
ncbi:MAG TPA: bifunctional phosphoglucose/phosphomannose isomerase [Candidatus Methanomethylophilaceae archaeon]|nr:bifunctional phosphoglucose/phosphomannose isomerase [Candidatus Methanomethylophilaceae archaeon]